MVLTWPAVLNCRILLLVVVCWCVRRIVITYINCIYFLTWFDRCFHCLGVFSSHTSPSSHVTTWHQLVPACSPDIVDSATSALVCITLRWQPVSCYLLLLPCLCNSTTVLSIPTRLPLNPRLHYHIPQETLFQIDPPDPLAGSASVKR